MDALSWMTSLYAPGLSVFTALPSFVSPIVYPGPTVPTASDFRNMRVPPVRVREGYASRRGAVWSGREDGAHDVSGTECVERLPPVVERCAPRDHAGEVELAVERPLREPRKVLRW